MDYQENNQYQPFQQYQGYNPPPYPPLLPPHRGAMILVFGIIGLFFCGIFGLLAWLFGNEDLRKMNEGQMDPSGRELTNAGRIMGIITVIIWGLSVLGSLIYFVFILGAFGATATQF